MPSRAATPGVDSLGGVHTCPSGSAPAVLPAGDFPNAFVESPTDAEVAGRATVHPDESPRGVGPWHSFAYRPGPRSAPPPGVKSSASMGRKTLLTFPQADQGIIRDRRPQRDRDRVHSNAGKRGSNMPLRRPPATAPTRIVRLPSGDAVKVDAPRTGGAVVWLVSRPTRKDLGGSATYLRIAEREAAAVARAVVQGDATFADLAAALARKCRWTRDDEFSRNLLPWLYAAAYASTCVADR